MLGMGKFFVAFVGQYGYDKMLSVLGRHVRDFINGKFFGSIIVHSGVSFLGLIDYVRLGY